MEWRDQGIVLGVRRHGESAVILEVLTAGRGRFAGVVRGGAGRRLAPVLQPAAQLDLTWRARLEEHLGHFTVEPLKQRAAHLMQDRLALLALASVCALLRFALPERAPQPVLYVQSCLVLDGLGAPGWLRGYLRWELQLLEQTGYGLDLDCCAVTGVREGLSHVSPRTGRAVSCAVAAEWADRLLALPPGLVDDAPMNHADLLSGLELTGYFLEQRLAAALGRSALPRSRARLLDALGRQ